MYLIINNLYAFSFIALAFFTIFWQISRVYKFKFKIPQKILLFTAGIYGFSLAIGVLTTQEVGKNLFMRDAIILIITAFLSALWAKKIKYFIPFLLIFTLLAFNLYLPKLKETFKPQEIITIDVALNNSDSLANIAVAHNSIPILPLNLSPEAELLVSLNPQADIQSLDAITALQKKYNLRIQKAFTSTYIATDDPLYNYYTVDINAQNLSHLNQIIEELNTTNAFESIENNELMKLSEIESLTLNEYNHEPQHIEVKNNTNDRYVSQQWSYNTLKMNELYDVLKTTKPQKKVKLAILDTGVDANHEDIKANFTSTKSSYDSDKVGHGTHCAGIAAAITNNKLGIASLIPNNAKWVEVTSIKVLNDNGSGSQKDIIDGIITAADTGCDVISMSLGGWSTYDRLKAYNEAIQYANKKGSIVVVAAGNDSRSATNTIPAACENVIVVTAINEQVELARFSNTVENIKMGIAAPGQNIFSTIPQNQYAPFSGTSMATPYTASIVAILKAINPKLNTVDIYNILDNSALKTQNANSGNIIQPAAAVQQLLNNAPPAIAENPS